MNYTLTRQQDYKLKLFTTVCAFVLAGERRIGWEVAAVLAQVQAQAWLAKKTPFFTFVNLVLRRCKLHRNATRGIVGDLVEKGIIKVAKYNAYHHHRFTINWTLIYQIKHDFGLEVNHAMPMFGSLIPSAAAWDAKRAEYRQRKRERAQQRREAIEAAQLRRLAQERQEATLSAPERRSALDKIRTAVGMGKLDHVRQFGDRSREECVRIEVALTRQRDGSNLQSS